VAVSRTAIELAATKFNVVVLRYLPQHTSAKRRKGYSLFSAAFALPAFVKNAVAFLKLF